MEIFLKKLLRKDILILSIDIDNTLVIRDKGANYINKETIRFLNKIIAHPRIILVPNTGREIVGFSAFENTVSPLQNAILASGSIIRCNGVQFFNEDSMISPLVLETLVNAVKSGIIPFVDFSASHGRFVVANEYACAEFPSLMFSQTPKEWYADGLPPVYSPEQFPYDNTEIFRAELPIRNFHTKLFNDLTKRSQHAFKAFAQLISLDKDLEATYSLNKQSLFNLEQKENFVFARFEKSIQIINKGKGLHDWLSYKGINASNVSIIHVGDQDTGLVNDAIIKSALPEAYLVMVGDKCEKDNPNVDLYLSSGEVEEVVREFLSNIIGAYEKIHFQKQNLESKRD